MGDVRFWGSLSVHIPDRTSSGRGQLQYDPTKHGRNSFATDSYGPKRIMDLPTSVTFCRKTTTFEHNNPCVRPASPKTFRQQNLLPTPMSELATMEEISIETFLSNFLTDARLTDITLQGTDGVSVRANRHVLAARSEVFHRMLLGNFAEAKEDIIQSSYKGQVLKAIVEYIVTDSAEILNGSISDNEEDKTLTMVSLVEAGTYFNLPRLSEKVLRMVGVQMGKVPGLSFRVLELCTQEGPSIPVELKMAAMSQIFRHNIIGECHRGGVSLLSATTLEAIVKDDRIQASEYMIFELVLHWVNARDEEVKESDRAGFGAPSPTTSHRAVASEIVQKHVHLDRIDPQLLSTTVKSSGLVPSESIWEAYQKQALAARAQNESRFKRPRYMPIWKTSKTDTFIVHSVGYTDVLVYPPMSRGLHQWTLQILKLGVGEAGVGIALASNHFLPRTVMLRTDGWEYCSQGISFYEGKGVIQQNLSTYQQGSTITLTLNLEEGDGTLPACVDGGDILSFRRSSFPIEGRQGRVCSCCH